MSVAFILLSGLVLASAVAAVSLRNLVRSALALSIAFAGLAGMYLHLGAQFVGFAQVLVYIGAVAILILFATLLTRGAEAEGQRLLSPGWFWGVGAAVVIFVVLASVIKSSRVLLVPTHPEPAVTVRQIGEALMSRGILPLEVLGLLLTATLIGAVIIAMGERPDDSSRGSREPGGATHRE